MSKTVLGARLVQVSLRKGSHRHLSSFLGLSFLQRLIQVELLNCYIFFVAQLFSVQFIRQQKQSKYYIESSLKNLLTCKEVNKEEGDFFCVEVITELKSSETQVKHK